MSRARVGLRGRVVAALAVGGLALVAAGCGLPTDSSPRDIPPEFALDAVPSTVAPVIPSATGPRAYFLSGPPGQLGTLLPVSRQVDAESIVQSLFDGLTTAEQSRGLRTAIPDITDRMLSDRLQELEHEGIVERTVIPETPVRVEYSLTKKGRELAAAMDAIAEWAEKWVETPKPKAPKPPRARSARAAAR